MPCLVEARHDALYKSTTTTTTTTTTTMFKAWHFVLVNEKI